MSWQFTAGSKINLHATHQRKAWHSFKSGPIGLRSRKRKGAPLALASAKSKANWRQSCMVVGLLAPRAQKAKHMLKINGWNWFHVTTPQMLIKCFLEILFEHGHGNPIYGVKQLRCDKDVSSFSFSKTLFATLVVMLKAVYVRLVLATTCPLSSQELQSSHKASTTAVQKSTEEVWRSPYNEQGVAERQRVILAPPFGNKMRVFAFWKCGGGELHLD